MNSLDVHEILKSLPHRYPFLLVDRVLACAPGQEITALKNVTINEPFFIGHFPHYPVMPGVLIVEALAQAAAILAFQTAEVKPDRESIYYFAGIDKARFKKPVSAGDQLILQVKITRRIQGVWKFSGEALVEGNVVATADIMCTMREIN